MAAVSDCLQGHWFFSCSLRSNLFINFFAASEVVIWNLGQKRFPTKPSNFIEENRISITFDRFANVTEHLTWFFSINGEEMWWVTKETRCPNYSMEYTLWREFKVTTWNWFYTFVYYLVEDWIRLFMFI